MNTRVSHLIPLIRDNLERYNQSDLEDAKQAMAEEMLACIHEDYEIKAAGGTGSDGISWEPTKKYLRDGLPMLIGTRELIDSFQIEITPTGFKIYNDVIYARRQFSQRMPWPEDQLPAAWMKRMLDAARPFIVKAATRATVQAIQQSGGTVKREIVHV